MWNNELGKLVILNMIAIFALMLAQVPIDAFASLRATENCKMPCCQHQHSQLATQPEKALVADSTCCSKKNSTQILVANVPNSCGCKIQSQKVHDFADAVLVNPTQKSGANLKSALTIAQIVVPEVADSRYSPPIFGVNSGTPKSEPSCVTMGRAPPVLLA